jgi:hypothetical protein
MIHVEFSIRSGAKGEMERCRQYRLAVVDHLMVVATGGYSSTFLGGP